MTCLTWPYFSVPLKGQIKDTPRYNWNSAKLDVKHQSINIFPGPLVCQIRQVPLYIQSTSNPFLFQNVDRNTVKTKFRISSVKSSDFKTDFFVLYVNKHGSTTQHVTTLHQGKCHFSTIWQKDKFFVWLIVCHP
jgi:hypothetical protein